MAGSVNKVIILGNLGVDPEVRNFPTVVKYVIFELQPQKPGKIEIQVKDEKKQSGTPSLFFLNP